MKCSDRDGTSEAQRKDNSDIDLTIYTFVLSMLFFSSVITVEANAGIRISIMGPTYLHT